MFISGKQQQWQKRAWTAKEEIDGVDWVLHATLGISWQPQVWFLRLHFTRQAESYGWPNSGGYFTVEWKAIDDHIQVRALSWKWKATDDHLQVRALCFKWKAIVKHGWALNTASETPLWSIHITPHSKQQVVVDHMQVSISRWKQRSLGDKTFFFLF